MTCTKGYFCNSQSVTPQPCPIGTFGTVLGASTAAECTNCPMGSYCNVAGMTASLPCPAGSYGPYTNGQTSSCVICPQVALALVGNRWIVCGSAMD